MSLGGEDGIFIFKGHNGHTHTHTPPPARAAENRSTFSAPPLVHTPRYRMDTSSSSSQTPWPAMVRCDLAVPRDRAYGRTASPVTSMPLGGGANSAAEKRKAMRQRAQSQPVLH